MDQNTNLTAHFTDLEIRIFHCEDKGYPVRITLDGQQEFPRGYMPPNIVPWISSGDPLADGQRLFDTLFADSALRSAWAEARGQARYRRIRLRIEPDAAELHALPWELLQEDNVVLSANADTPFSRYLPVKLPWGGAVAERPIRVLVVISNPDDLHAGYNLAPLDVGLERKTLEEALAPVSQSSNPSTSLRASLQLPISNPSATLRTSLQSPTSNLQLDFLDPPVTLERLEKTLRSGYQVVHYSGHGAYSARRQQAGLYLQDGEGQTEVVPDDELAGMITRLDDEARPLLVFLAACQSATRDTGDAFLGLGPKLVSIGVPAVVAMQDDVAIETARKLSATFYQRLLEHGLVDKAMNEARSTLLSDGRPDAAVPVLFMRLKEGRLFQEIPAAVEEYLAAVREYCANLPYLTLHDIRPPKTLDEVYVPLKARPQLREAEPDLTGRGRSASVEDLSGRERRGPLSIAEVMQQREQPHVLILGEPGAGKTTLMRQLAEHAWDAPQQIGLEARYLPILVPLRRLANADGSLEDRLNRALTGELALTRALSEGFFTDWPAQTGANWLVLLDALDEVPAGERARLMQWLRGVIKSINRPQNVRGGLPNPPLSAGPSDPAETYCDLLGIGSNCVIITSRPSGYSPGELDEKLFGHYDLLSFTPEQTREFARKWFGDKANRFLEELERVRAGDLRGTPLLLTIAAKVYLETGALPERRSALYGQFVDIWLGEAEQRGLKAELGEKLEAPVDLQVARLAHLALRVTEQPANGDLETPGRFVAEYLKTQEEFTRIHAKIYGKQFVEVMARRSGVFTRRGDVYDFIHPTFREYLAAWAVVRECEQDLEQVWQRAVSRWRDENWREVALFTLSILGDAGQDVTPLVGRAWQEGDEEGLYFAGAALAGQVRVEDNLGDSIIDALLAEARGWSWGPSWAILGELRGYPYAGEGLLALACDEKVYERVRQEAAEALGKLGRVDEAAPVLLALARDEKVWGGRRQDAAEALGKLGRADDLLALARDEKVEAGVRRDAAEALDELGRVDEATQAWLALARDEKVGWRVRVEAAEALGELGRVDEAAHILLALARDVKVEAWVRQAAAEALGKLGRADKAALVLLALAHDEKVDERVRRDAAEALGELGRVDEAVPILLALARDEKVAAGVRQAAAEALGRLERVDEAAQAWLALARDEKVDERVRRDAVEALGKLGRADETAQAWLALARDEKVEAWVRQAAAGVLGKLGRVDETAQAWLALARDEKVEAGVRKAAAATLGKLGRVDEAAQAWLALACDEKVDEWVRRKAAGALGKLGRADEAAQAWLALARDEKVWEGVRRQAAGTLGKLGRADDLLALVRDGKVDEWVRKWAAEALGKLGRVDEAAQAWLALARDEKVDKWKRRQAAAALGQFASAGVLPDLERIARKDKDEQVRRAAREAIERIRSRT